MCCIDHWMFGAACQASSGGTSPAAAGAIVSIASVTGGNSIASVTAGRSKGV